MKTTDKTAESTRLLDDPAAGLRVDLSEVELGPDGLPRYVDPARRARQAEASHLLTSPTPDRPGPAASTSNSPRPIPAPPRPARIAPPDRPPSRHGRVAALDARNDAELLQILVQFPPTRSMTLGERRYRGAVLRRLAANAGPEALARWLRYLPAVSDRVAGDEILLDEVWERVRYLLRQGEVEGIADIEQLSFQGALDHAWDRIPSLAHRGRAGLGGATGADAATTAADPGRRRREETPRSERRAAAAVPPAVEGAADLCELIAFVAAARRGEPVDRPLFGGISLGDFLLQLARAWAGPR